MHKELQRESFLWQRNILPRYLSAGGWIFSNYLKHYFMENQLKDKRVAMVVANGFEEVELTKPLEALKNAGATVDIISPEEKTVRAWAEKDWGKDYPVDKNIKDVVASSYDALVLPGGVMNPDHLRTNDRVIAFVTGFFDESKPIAAICHGPWTLIETGELDGRKVTSYPSLKTDLENAGALWTDEEVVTDKGLVTSRTPKDLPAFCRKMVEEFAEGPHDQRSDTAHKGGVHQLG